MTPRRRILLADDHMLILEGFQKVLEPSYEVIGAVPDGKALVEGALRLRPDMVILDVAMPVLNGIDAARQVREQLPDIKVVFVTMHSNPTYVQEALKAGASGYVLKSSAREELLTAVQEAFKGNCHVSERAAELPVAKTAAKESAGPLTARERAVLTLIAEGKSTKDAAFLLKVSTRTIEFHRDNIKAKLGLRTIAELTVYAIHRSLITLPPPKPDSGAP